MGEESLPKKWLIVLVKGRFQQTILCYRKQQETDFRQLKTDKTEENIHAWYLRAHAHIWVTRMIAHRHRNKLDCCRSKYVKQFLQRLEASYSYTPVTSSSQTDYWIFRNPCLLSLVSLLCSHLSYPVTWILMTYHTLILCIC